MAGSKEETPIEHDNRGWELEKKKNEWELLSAGTFLNEGEKERKESGGGEIEIRTTCRGEKEEEKKEKKKEKRMDEMK